MRQHDIDDFYKLIDGLESIFPKRKLKDCNGRNKWPKQGVYFFFEHGQLRQNGKDRVVRIGTHGVSENSSVKLWERLRLHRGTKKGSGNHRSSVFRELVGRSILSNDKAKLDAWLSDTITNDQQQGEKEIELRVSKIIGDMPFLVLAVPGESKKDNLRAFIETNAIALLSNRDKTPRIDGPTNDWLGYSSGHKDVISSGLWNSDDTEKNYDPGVIQVISKHIKMMEKV